MHTSRRASGYDLFKLIIAIILLILFFLLRSNVTPQAPSPISTLLSSPSTTLLAKPTTSSSSSTLLLLTATSIPALSPTQTNISKPTGTAFPESTTTRVVLSTQTPLPSPTITIAAESTVTLPPSFTETPMASSTPTPGTAVASACNTASSRSRLQAGMSIIILRRLNFRSSPGIGHNWLRTNIPGTRAEVLSGPECIPHSIGAYLWWQIKLPDGEIGWSAEASQQGTFYFMEQTK
jgi:hypothetical protein